MKWSGQAHFSCFDGGQIIEKETKGGRWKKLVMKKRQEVECRNMLANSLYMYTAKQEWEFRWKMREEATWKRREWIDGGEQVSIYSTDIERRRGEKKTRSRTNLPKSHQFRTELLNLETEKNTGSTPTTRVQVLDSLTKSLIILDHVTPSFNIYMIGWIVFLRFVSYTCRCRRTGRKWSRSVGDSKKKT